MYYFVPSSWTPSLPTPLLPLLPWLPTLTPAHALAALAPASLAAHALVAQATPSPPLPPSSELRAERSGKGFWKGDPLGMKIASKSPPLLAVPVVILGSLSAMHIPGFVFGMTAAAGHKSKLIFFVLRCLLVMSLLFLVFLCLVPATRH